MMFFMACVIGFIVAVSVMIVGGQENIERKTTAKKKVDDYVAENDLALATTFIFEDTLSTWFIADQKNRNVHIIRMLLGDKMYIRKVSFSDVIGCEIVGDNIVIGGVGRAIAGGIVAGEAGAVVGAMTANKTALKNYKVVLYCASIEEPIIEMPLISGEQSKTSVRCESAIEFANKVNACVKAIMVLNERNA